MVKREEPHRRTRSKSSKNLLRLTMTNSSKNLMRRTRSNSSKNLMVQMWRWTVTVKPYVKGKRKIRKRITQKRMMHLL